MQNQPGNCTRDSHVAPVIQKISANLEARGTFRGKPQPVRLKIGIVTQELTKQIAYWGDGGIITAVMYYQMLSLAI